MALHQRQETALILLMCLTTLLTKNAVRGADTIKDPIVVDEQNDPKTVDQQSDPIAVSQQSDPVVVSDQNDPIALNEENDPVVANQQNDPISMDQSVAVEQDKELNSVTEESLDPPDNLEKQIDQTVQNSDEKKMDTSRSFSIGDILKTIMDPMFEETDKKVKESKDNEIEPVLNESAGIEKNESAYIESQEAEKEINKTDKKMKFKCISRNITQENVTSTVKIINNTRLLQILNFDKNDTLSDCVLVMFYAPWCRFCAKVAPSFNALARAFTELDVVAVDAAHFSNLNARFGTVSVPNILLFHQSRAVVRFNQTDKQFENLVSFVKNHTGMEPDITTNVTDEDYKGPLPSIPSNETDYLLWISWLFVVIFISVVFIRSSYGQHYINKVKILWQEHQHIE